jgi:hypothetical protein
MRDFNFEKKDNCTLIRMKLYLNVSDGDIFSVHFIHAWISNFFIELSWGEWGLLNITQR